MKIIKIKKVAQQNNEAKKDAYTVRSMIKDLLKWEKFLEIIK